MPITRLTYHSQNLIDRAQGSVVRVLSRILSASNRNNKPLGVTGALVFDEQWFIQVLEGERQSVWRTFEPIRDDERHAEVVVVEVVETEKRLFGKWSMGLGVRSARTEAAFAVLPNGRFNPHHLSAAEILAFVTALSKAGLEQHHPPVVEAA